MIGACPCDGVSHTRLSESDTRRDGLSREWRSSENCTQSRAVDPINEVCHGTKCRFYFADARTSARLSHSRRCEMSSIEIVMPPEISEQVALPRVMLSIIMPAYDEGRTIVNAVEQVLSTRFPCPIELIVVDDGSRDDTAEVLAAIHDPRLHVHRHLINKGKGAALLTGFSIARGTHVVPFDADLEYSPGDLLPLLEPVLSGRTNIVYGSRLFGANTVYQSYRYAMGNKVTTLLANVLFDAYISDLHTCLKLMPISLIGELQLREQGFGLDTEITAQLLKLGHRPFEVPVSYHSRTHAQGKKLNWRDGVACIAILFRVRSQCSRRHPAVPIAAPQHAEVRLLKTAGQMQ